jgi:hypothetical protein
MAEPVACCAGLEGAYYEDQPLATATLEGFATAHLHVALALVSADEEDKLVETPELILLHGLQTQHMEPQGLESSICCTNANQLAQTEECPAGVSSCRCHDCWQQDMFTTAK